MWGTGFLPFLIKLKKFADSNLDACIFEPENFCGA